MELNYALALSNLSKYLIYKTYFLNFPDNMFNRQMQYGGSSKNPQSSKNEANLMPVPSPQQIQYLNPLDGKELTIQKQPNTSLRDQDPLSPSYGDFYTLNVSSG